MTKIPARFWKTFSHYIEKSFKFRSYLQTENTLDIVQNGQSFLSCCLYVWLKERCLYNQWFVVIQAWCRTLGLGGLGFFECCNVKWAQTKNMSLSEWCGPSSVSRTDDVIPAALVFSVQRSVCVVVSPGLEVAEDADVSELFAIAVRGQRQEEGPL